MTSVYKPEVLRLYRKVFRIARTWAAEHERAYMRDEARRLVRRNAKLENAEEISAKVQEFEARIETGVHYKIPYPRPINVVPGATGKDPESVTPVYLHSYGSGGLRTGGGRVHRVPVYDES